MNMKTKVTRITVTEFELEDGRIFPHVTPLNPVPTLEEFQEHYNKWLELLKSQNEQSGNTPKSR